MSSPRTKTVANGSVNPKKNWWTVHGPPGIETEAPSDRMLAQMVFKSAFPRGAFFDAKGVELKRPANYRLAVNKLCATLRAALQQLNNLVDQEMKGNYQKPWFSIFNLLTQRETYEGPRDHLNTLKHVERLLILFGPLFGMPNRSLTDMLANVRRQPPTLLQQQLKGDLYDKIAAKLDFAPIPKMDVQKCMDRKETSHVPELLGTSNASELREMVNESETSGERFERVI